MKKLADVVVDIPENDSPTWGRVGVIALAGFVVGVAWPKVTGIKLGPNAPTESVSTPAASLRAPEAPREVSLSAAALQGKPHTSQGTSASAVPSAGNAPPPAAGMAATVGHGAILSCKTSDGETKKGTKECGSSGFDVVAMPRLKNLAQCTAVGTEKAKVSAVFTLDYAGGKLDMNLGRSSTVRDESAVLACMRTEFNGVVLKGIPHEHARYVVAYGVAFEPAKDTEPKPAAPASGTRPADAKPETGSSQVTWETALVRDTPKTGAVVARLPRGTKVTPSTSRDGWFKISYADGEGWVYRGAIGR